MIDWFSAMSRLRSAVQKGKRAALENTEVIKSSNKKKSKPAIKEGEWFCVQLRDVINQGNSMFAFKML